MGKEEGQTQGLRSALEALQLEITQDAEFAGIFANLQEDYEAAKQEPGFIEANWFGRLTKEQVHRDGLLMQKNEALSAREQDEYDGYREIQRRSDVPHNNFYHAFTLGTNMRDFRADHEEVMRAFDDMEIGARMRKAIKLDGLKQSVTDAGMPLWRRREFAVFATFSQEFQEEFMMVTVNTVLASAVTVAYDYLQEAGVDVENYTG